ncbi:alpha/beta hydrolase family protein [Deinococcus hopiensis]|uniref:alpha/beta hydrolase family protein n=1 Tax=Deinococcus hopiensis TaxID=309885 RepID=UPI0009FF1FF9|nr:alpha/beta fold hydrolase [Deinococcus hopiensis]
MEVPGLTLPLLADAAPLTLHLPDVALGGYGWWHSKPAPAALLLHGWGQDASAMALPAQAFRAAGWHAVSLSMRGWRGSSGCDDYGRSGVRDTCRALTWLAGQQGVTDVLLLGFSMGGLMALLTASVPSPARAVVAVSAPTELRRVYQTTSFGGLRRYYDAVLTPEQWVEGSPLHHAHRLTVPALVVVGLEDRVCPPQEGRSYASAAQARLLEVPGMAHQPSPSAWFRIVEASLML